MWDGQSEHKHPIFKTSEEGIWRMMIFNVRGVSFYLQFMYSSQKQAFIIFILLGDTVVEANKYKAKMWIEESKDDDPQKTDFLQQVVSIEEHCDIDGPLDNSKYIVIPYGEMEPYFAITKNPITEEYVDENEKYTLAIPVQIEEIIKSG